MTVDVTSCVFCGLPRPPDLPRCPTCNRGWIDAHVVPPAADPPTGGAPAPGGTDSVEPPPAGTPPAARVAAGAPSAPEGSPVGPPAADEPAIDADPAAAPPAEVADPGDAPEPAVPVVGPSTVAAPRAGPADAGHPPGRRPDERPGDRPPDGRPDSPATTAFLPGGVEPDDAPVDPPDAPPPRRSRLGQRLLMAGVVVALIAGWFGALTWITADDEPDVDAPPGTTAAALAPSPVTTTIPEPTTSSPSEPTTTTVDPAILTGPFPEVGNPVDIIDLRLGAFAVGPIDFGDPDGLGRLVATLGQPTTARTVDDGTFGLCPGEPGFTATWGPFTALFTGTPDDGELVGYRLESEPPDHPTAGLSTLSELSLGDSVADLEARYPGFEISYEAIEGSLSFVLVRSDGVTLLWGPVTSRRPDGTVRGIYSPEPCDGGPVPSG